MRKNLRLLSILLTLSFVLSFAVPAGAASPDAGQYPAGLDISMFEAGDQQMGLLSLPNIKASDITLANVDYANETLTISAGNLSMISFSTDTKTYELYADEADEDGVLKLSDYWGKKLTFLVFPSPTLQALTLPARPAKPAPKIDFALEKITAVSNLMEIRSADTPEELDEEDFEPLGAVTVPASDYLGKTVEIRLKSTSSKPASLSAQLTVPARLAAPSASEFTVNFATAALTMANTTTAYEVSIDDKATWTAATKTFALAGAFSKDVEKIYVRIKSTTTNFASSEVEKSISAEKADAPDVTLDLAGEKLKGVSKSTMEYSITKGDKWVAFTADGDFSISAILDGISTTTPLAIYVRTKALAAVPASASVIFTFTARPAAPTGVTLDVKTEEIKGLTADKSLYRFDTTSTWTAAEASTAALSATAKTIQVRNVGIASDEEDDPAVEIPASKILTLTVPTRGTKPSPVYSSVTDAITGVTTAMEYQPLDAADSEIKADKWEKVATANMSGTAFKVVLPDEDETRLKFVVFRIAPVEGTGTSAKLASLPSAVIKVAATTAKPTGITFDKATEAIKGMTALMEYRLKGATAWTAASATPLNISAALDKATAELVYEVRIKAVTSGTGVAPASEAAEVEAGMREDLEEELSWDTATGKVKNLDGDTAYEFRLSTATAWTAFTEAGLQALVPAASATKDVTVYIRAKASADAVASNYQTLTLKPRAKTPAAKLDPANETIKDVTTNMQVKIGTADWADVDGTTIDISAVGYSGNVDLQLKDVSTVPASDVQKITVSRPAAPKVTANYTNMTFTGATALMEYAVDPEDEDAEWEIVALDTTLKAMLINEEMSGKTVGFRLAATATVLKSGVTKISVLESAAQPAITVSFDYLTETLKGSKTGSEFRVGTTGAWTALGASAVALPAAAKTALDEDDVDVYYRDMAVTGTSPKPPSTSVKITVTKRAAAPDVSFDNATAKLKDITTGMEYSADKAKWTKFTSDSYSPALKTTDQKIYVRTLASETAVASLFKEVTIPASAAAPAVPATAIKYNAAGGKITLSLENTLEFAIGSSSTWTTGVPAGFEIITDSEDEDYSGYNMTADVPVSVRTKAIGGGLPSQSAVLTLKKSAAAPTTVQVNYSLAAQITGLTTAMEYKFVESGDTGTFAACTGTSLILTSGDYGKKLVVRIKGTDSAPPSLEVSKDILAAAAAPTGITAADGIVSGVLTTMEYSLNGKYWIPVTATKLDLNWLRGDSSVDVKIRIKGTSTKPASQEATVTVGALD